MLDGKGCGTLNLVGLYHVRERDMVLFDDTLFCLV